MRWSTLPSLSLNAGSPRPSAETPFGLRRPGNVCEMSGDPTWPVFCLDGANVVVVWAPTEVPIALDPVLVDEPVKLIDSRGRRLRKVVSEPKGRRWLFRYGPEIIGVELDAEGTDDSELLRQTLTGYLRAAGGVIPATDDIEAFARAAAPLIR